MVRAGEEGGTMSAYWLTGALQMALLEESQQLHRR